MKILIVMLLLLASCSKSPQLCDAGKIAANVLAVPVASRWVCDNSKMLAFFESKVGPYTCPEVATTGAVEQRSVSLQQMLCPLVIGSLVNLGADKIVEDLECDKAKVLADLSNQTKLCDLFNTTP